MGSGDDVVELASGEWRRRGRLGGWRVDKTMVTWRVGSGDDVGESATGEWRRQW